MTEYIFFYFIQLLTKINGEKGFEGVKSKNLGKDHPSLNIRALQNHKQRTFVNNTSPEDFQQQQYLKWIEHVTRNKNKIR